MTHLAGSRQFNLVFDCARPYSIIAHPLSFSLSISSHRRREGFSVGDELGFPESLGNVEGSKRRALNLRTGANQIGVLPAAKMPVRRSHSLTMSFFP
jgi:hypothetical protein